MKLKKNEIDIKSIKPIKSELKTPSRTLEEMGLTDFGKIRKSSILPQPDYNAMLNRGVNIDDVINLKIVYDQIPAYPSCYSMRHAYFAYEAYANILTQANEIISRYSGRDSLSELHNMVLDFTGYHEMQKMEENDPRKAEVSARWFACLKEEKGCPLTKQNDLKTRNIFYKHLDDRSWLLTEPKPNREITKGNSRNRSKDLEEYLDGVNIYKDEDRFHAMYKGIILTPEEGCESSEELSKQVLHKYETLISKPGSIGMKFLQNHPRKGPRRHSGNITEEQFVKHFNLQRIDFGRSISAKEKKATLSALWDALADLAAILNMPEDKIGQYGKLAISYGVNNKRRSSGSIERITLPDGSRGIMMALSDKVNPGSLAHEYMHVCDYMPTRVIMNSNHPMSSMIIQAGVTPEENLPINDAVLALDSLKTALKGMPDNSFIERSEAYGHKLDQIIEKKSGKTNNNKMSHYMGRMDEGLARVFEIYAMEKLKTMGIENPFLTSVNKTGAFRTPGYPTDAEMIEFAPHMENTMSFLSTCLEDTISILKKRMEQKKEQSSTPVQSSLFD